MAGKTRDDDFFNFQGKMVNEVVTNAAGWGIPGAEVTALTTRRAAYEPLYHKSQEKEDRTSGDVDRHRQMRKTYEKEIQVFVNARIRYNALISRDERIEIGIPPRDTEPSPSAPITDRPVTVLRNLGGGYISFGYKATTDQTRYSMHPDATNVEYRYAIVEPGDIPPDDFDNYPKQRSSSRAKFVVKLGSKNIGKRLYVVSRWVNKHRPIQEGPWATPSNEVIA